MRTQKNRLNETVLLITQTYVKTDVSENIYNFTLKFVVYLNLEIDHEIISTVILFHSRRVVVSYKHIA